MTTEFVTLANHTDYEILNAFPYTIRKKSTGKVISECIDNNGYYKVSLSDSGEFHQYYKHIIIANQFIPNPMNLPCVDHINHNRTDNRLENLRYVSYSGNNRNKSSHLNVIYEFVDDIPDESLVVNEYGNHSFDDYYYNKESDTFYYYNGQQYRVLHVNTLKNGRKFVYMRDTNNKIIHVFLNKFKKLYNIV